MVKSVCKNRGKTDTHVIGAWDRLSTESTEAVRKGEEGTERA